MSVTVVSGQQTGSYIYTGNTVTWADLTTWGAYNSWRVPGTSDVVVQILDDLGSIQTRAPTIDLGYYGDISVSLDISDTGDFTGEQTTVSFVLDTPVGYVPGRYYRWTITVSANSDFAEPALYRYITQYQKTRVTELLNDVETYTIPDSEGEIGLTTQLGYVNHIQATALQGDPYVLDGYLITRQDDTTAYVRSPLDITNSSSTGYPNVYSVVTNDEIDPDTPVGPACYGSPNQLYKASMTAAIGADFLDFGTADWCFESYIWVSEFTDPNSNSRLFEVNTNVADPDFVATFHLLIKTGAVTADGWTVDATINVNGSDQQVTGTTLFAVDQWYHVAFQRNGTQVEIFVDGNLEASATLGATDTIVSDGSTLSIGGVSDTSANAEQFFQGRLDEIRVSNTSRYTDPFTPPNYIFSNDPNTVLLLNQDTADTDSTGADIIVDNGGTSYGADRYIIEQNNGSPVVQQKNPPKIRLLDANQEYWDGLVDVLLAGYPKVKLTSTGVKTITISGGI